MSVYTAAIATNIILHLRLHLGE